jgi:photosystem II stability/assembly factor-like uncharacterized protein
VKDGGISWQLVWETTQKGVFLDGIAFWDAQNGLIFGDPIDNHWFLLKTTDSGKTWQSLSPTLLPPNLPNEAAFAASNSAMTVQGKKNVWIGTGGADFGRIFYSKNQGKTWQVVATDLKANASSGLFGLRFWNKKNGIAVGGDYKATSTYSDNVLLTNDGGQTWQKATPTQPEGLKEAAFRLKNGQLVAVGPAGSSISKDHGQSWQPIAQTPAGLHALTCVGNTCWAIGAKGVIVKLN